MEPIFPLHEEHIEKFCGMPVCIVTKEGQRHVGILSSCRGGRLMLNENQGYSSAASVGTAGGITHVQSKSKKKGRKTGKTVQTLQTDKAETQSYDPYYPYNGFAPYSPYAEAFAIDLALIAFLFLLL
ncbi:hypothetical protein KZ483_23455 [Paenibacillus sp. sptzw28]|uniref:hypothetical protein n=1 Tax=Paenibacillus sp. sptzw28 TaxID=715179 RepID=UPI001C6F1521|nr:hypothetical protein [Paenibacillus sp. sptzw28]QYR20708.1 hypothetical protein KZ483_23455 [Paenibacillus sp. sptzw28]